MTTSVLSIAKGTLSLLLVSTAVLLVAYAITHNYCQIHLPSPIIFGLIVVSLSVLGYFESGQVALVNLNSLSVHQAVKFSLSQPRTFDIYMLTSSSNGLERYLTGRQLCVLALVFFISLLTTFPTMPDLLPRLPQSLFISSGLPGALITLIFGQMYPQLIGDEYTVRFLDSFCCYIFVRVALLVESLGVFTSCSFVIAHQLSRLTDSPPLIQSNLRLGQQELIPISGVLENNPIYPPRDYEEPEDSHLVQATARARTGYDALPSLAVDTYFSSARNRLTTIDGCSQVRINCSSVGDMVIKIISVTLCVVCGLITLGNVFNRTRKFVELDRLLLLLLSMVAIFYLEGLQIAVLSTQHSNLLSVPIHMKRSYALHALLQSKSSQVKNFLIGRQFLVVLAMFAAASASSFRSSSHVLPIPEIILRCLVKPGFAGVIFILNTVQLPSQIFAKLHPWCFLNLPGASIVVNTALAIESVGIAHLGWAMYFISSSIQFRSKT